MKVSVTANTPGLQALLKLVDDKRGLAQAMGTEVQTITAAHLLGLAATRHATANRLGADPTGFLSQASEKVAAPAALTSDDASATLVINHPGMIRAFRSVTIRPKTAKALAIPIAGEAYGHRPKELTARGIEMFVLGGKRRDVGRNILARKEPDGTVVPLYILVASVTQPQDRSLLPSDEQWEAAAVKGGLTYAKMKLEAAGRS